jgi:hypothetical protein
MADETVSATTIINAPAGAVFAVLAEPASHVAIDGTGWVCEALDSQRLTAEGQVFRMTMYHPNHPDGNYQMANRVQGSTRRAPSPGRAYDAGDGSHRFGGWSGARPGTNRTDRNQGHLVLRLVGVGKAPPASVPAVLP